MVSRLNVSSMAVRLKGMESITLHDCGGSLEPLTIASVAPFKRRRWRARSRLSFERVAHRSLAVRTFGNSLHIGPLMPARRRSYPSSPLSCSISSRRDSISSAALNMVAYSLSIDCQGSRSSTKMSRLLMALRLDGHRSLAYQPASAVATRQLTDWIAFCSSNRWRHANADPARIAFDKPLLTFDVSAPAVCVPPASIFLWARGRSSSGCDGQNRAQVDCDKAWLPRRWRN